MTPTNLMTNRFLSRRRVIAGGAAALAAGPSALRALGDEPAAPASSRPATARSSSGSIPGTDAPKPPGEPGRDYTPVVTPNGVTLPYKVVGEVKVFHLVAEPVRHEFASGLVGDCWGYNGRTPGPTIEAVEGDRVRIYVTNRLPASTSVHWHGLRLPNGMDGVSGVTQAPIEPGQTFRYEFTLNSAGTYMYHPHRDDMVQQGLGMMGMFVVHPRDPEAQKIARVDRDFCLMLSEWRIDPGSTRPNPLEMIEFNVLTFNSRAYPGTDALVVKQGERVRIRFGNLGAMDHHPIHLHGYQFLVTETDAGSIPPPARYKANTVLVPVGSTRAIEFVADNPGDWPMHCHMTHHTMNQMGHNTENMVGVRTGDMSRRVRALVPGYMAMGKNGMAEMAEMRMPAPPNSIPMKGAAGPFGVVDMGGMFTLLKVRETLTTYADPGWYAHPAGTVASPATDDELRRDGISAG